MLVLSLAIFVLGLQEVVPLSCIPCGDYPCQDPVCCNSGLLTKDVCGCCNVCAKAENEPSGGPCASSPSSSRAGPTAGAPPLSRRTTSPGVLHRLILMGKWCRENGRTVGKTVTNFAMTVYSVYSTWRAAV